MPLLTGYYLLEGGAINQEWWDKATKREDRKGFHHAERGGGAHKF